MARRKVKMEMAEPDQGIKRSPLRHTNGGHHEELDPVPMQPPMGYKRTPTLSEQIRMQVMQMKVDWLQNENFEESEDEADDFEIGEDFEPLSQHENDHIPPIAVLKARVKAYNQLIAEENRKAYIKAHEEAIKKPVEITTPAAQPTGNKVSST